MFVIFLYQVYYRLGLSLVVVKRFEDVMDFFIIVFEFVEIDEEKYDILLQIIIIGLEVEGMLYIIFNICEENMIIQCFYILLIVSCYLIFIDLIFFRFNIFLFFYVRWYFEYRRKVVFINYYLESCG